ncbi:GNAT family N-acetyltransferase [Streptomyces sp. NPDC002580]|uniref:GNAT family N-acetyltransferase n=1 Tax=Streptomyces sp. NPDC002580 TaxID=3364653 RepID=UPI0036A07192
MTVTLRVDATPSAAALFLRPWNDDDLEALVEAYRDPTLRRWAGIPVTNLEDSVGWLKVQRHGWETGERLSFAVCEDRSDAGEGGPAGNVVLKRSGPRRDSAEVGYWTAAHARGRGVAPRALEVLTDWAFDEFAADGLVRLDLIHQVDNLASCRVAEKVGYGFDRILPAQPPYPRDGHLHVRRADTPA